MQSLFLADVLPFLDCSSTGASVLIRGKESSSYSPVPLHNVFLLTVSGSVILGISSSLPFNGVNLFLGND